MLNLTTLTKKENKALEEFVAKIADELGDKVVCIKLFGSKARGDYRKKSDIDLLIVTSEKDSAIEDNILDKVLDVEFKYDIFLSVLIFPLAEFNYLNSIPTVFMQVVKKEGIDLWRKE